MKTIFVVFLTVTYMLHTQPSLKTNWPSWLPVTPKMSYIIVPTQHMRQSTGNSQTGADTGDHEVSAVKQS